MWGFWTVKCSDDAPRVMAPKRARRTDSDTASAKELDIENFIAQSSSDLFARLSESDNDSPSPDVIKRLTALPKEQARIAATKVAAALEEKLDSLWKATEEQQFLELSALSSGVKLEEAAEEKKRQARTQLNVEGPRACALLARLWAAAEEARSSAGDGSSHDEATEQPRLDGLEVPRGALGVLAGCRQGARYSRGGHDASERRRAAIMQSITITARSISITARL